MRTSPRHTPKTADEHALTAGHLKRGYCPLIFDGNANAVPLEGLYYGCSAFLVLNGPSAVKINPDDLRGLFVATVNNGPRIIRGSMNVMLDPPFRFSLSQWLDPTVAKFVPMTHAKSRLFDNRKIDGKQQWQWADKRVVECPNVFFFRRSDKFDAARFLTDRTVNWGDVSKDGARSVMLTALRLLCALGFKEIYLCGADFQMNAENRYSYKMEASADSAKGNNRAYGIINKFMTQLQPYLLKSGVNVYNCTPASRLTAFPQMTLAEAAKKARAPLGDWRSEKMEGMYDDKAKKNLLNNAPAT